MQTANLSDAKNRLSELVERVRSGDRVRILVRGVPVADLVPVQGDAGGDDRLADLERRGVIRRGTGVIPALLREPGPAVGGTPLSDLLLAERDEGP